MGTLAAAIHATVYRGGGDPSLIFDLPLLTGIIPGKAINPTPTFTRATAATFTDHEGIIRDVPSGCARFPGARMVRNLIRYSQAADNWLLLGGATITANSTVAPDGTLTADRINATGDNSRIHQNHTLTIGTVAGRAFCASVWLKTENGLSGKAEIAVLKSSEAPFTGSSPTNGKQTVDIDGTWRRYAAIVSAGVGATDTTIKMLVRAGRYNAGTGEYQNTYVWGMQLEEITGASVQAPGEYVSVDVLTAPYQGAGIDGVQFFTSANGNSVGGNFIVTEAGGSAISDSTLKGYLSEPTRTNSIQQSADLTVWWGSARVTLSALASVGPTGAQVMSKVTEDTTPANTHYVATQEIAKDAVAENWSFSCWYKSESLARGFIAYIYDTAGGTTNAIRFTCRATGVNDVVASGTGWTAGSCGMVAHPTISDLWYCWCTFTSSTAATIRSNIYMRNATTISYDGDGVSALYLGGIQLEEGWGPTSIINTAGAVVQRLTDVLTYPISNFSADEGAYSVVWSPLTEMPIWGAGSNLLGNSTNGSGARYLYDGAGADNIASLDGVSDIYRNTVTHGPGAAPRTYTVRGSYSKAGNSRRLAIAGYASTAGTHQGFDVTTGPALLGVTNDPHISSAIKNVKVHNAPKSQAWVEAA